eukprot:CAMPEP_0203683060 /NCGR_PEP_ID=MMETSP0090-20130426/47319_1 /ASSEMBLY_ACC=CAM_ASM_001088 /TAXON_ID=426623 /ORGANISM="Chaetoceros affinis, Strain CCMP159" /LENGTH=378 /DNA_ID=CAMNT_0050552181 /DNA_START=80 /DNA_END=1216 /DNA_ORIENTATION=-
MSGNGETKIGTTVVKKGLAQMLKGGVIMDVMNVEQAKIAEAAGAVAVMALERIPADIRRDGGVARMSDPAMILEIKNAVTIPVMAKSRIGHYVESQILEACEIDYIDESEVLTMADEENHIDKTQFNVPFVCGCRDLGEALRRVAEGAAMLRTKGEAGTGNIVEAVRHARTVQKQIKALTVMSKDELFVAAKELRAPYELVKYVADNGKLPVVNFAAGGVATPADAALMMQLGMDGVFVGAKELRAPYELVKYVADNGKLPVVNFAAGGVATPADAALMMQLGMDGVFVGSGIFKSHNPAVRAAAIVRATTHYNDPKVLMEVSTGLGPAMVGISDIKGDPVNFRDREGGSYVYEGKVPPKRELHGATEIQIYGSSWNK